MRKKSATGAIHTPDRRGAVLKRGAELHLVLLAGSVLEADGVRLQSSRPSVFVTVGAGRLEVVAESDAHFPVARILYRCKPIGRAYAGVAELADALDSKFRFKGSHRGAFDYAKTMMNTC